MSAHPFSTIRSGARALTVIGVAVVGALLPVTAHAAPTAQPADLIRLNGAVHVVADGAALVVPLELRCSTPDSGAFVTVTQVVRGRVVSGEGGAACTSDLTRVQVLATITYPPSRAFHAGSALVNVTVGSVALHRTVAVTPTDSAQSSSPGLVLPPSLTLQAGGTAVRGKLRVRCSPDSFQFQAVLMQVAAQNVHAISVYGPCPASSGLQSVPVWFFESSQPGPAWHVGPALLTAATGSGPGAFRVVNIETGSR